MYPARQLRELNAAKAALTVRIARERIDCRAQWRELEPRLAAIDRALGWLRRLPPWVRLAGLAATLVAGRKLASATGSSLLMSFAALLLRRGLARVLR